MKHAQIAAEARRPYADKIKRDQETIDSLCNALAMVLDTVAVYRGNNLPHCLDSIEETALTAIELARGSA